MAGYRKNCRNRPLTDEELLDIIENLSDIADPTDDFAFEDDGWGVEELLETQDDISEDESEETTLNSDKRNKSKERLEETKEQIRNNSGKKQVPKQNAEIKVAEVEHNEKLKEKQIKIKQVQAQQQIDIVSTADDLDVVSHEVRDNANDFFVNNDFTKKADIKWRSNVTYQTPPIRWYEQQSPEIVELESPLHFYCQYFTENLYELMVENTNLYAVQQSTRFEPTNVQELKVFVGIHIIMGNTHYPRIKNYWEPRLKISLVANNMTVNRFYKLRHHIHFVNNNEKPNSDDRFWKVRPLYDCIRTKCLDLPLESQLSIDEQMVPFKGQLNVKQYVKGKPSPWGIKIFALCGTSGLLYDFIIYQGATTELDKVCFKYMGLGASVVATLVRRITVNNCELYYDNYFSNYNLLQYLRRRNIWASGTARIDRFKSPSFSTDKILQQKGRGTSEQVISDDGEVIMTKWFDNKAVIVASNYMGIGNEDSCKRWDKKQKKYIQIPRPEVIRNYNMHMGGVDKMDFLITLYRSFIRSKKWTLRMFTHAIDISCVNSWLEYKQKAIALGVEKKKILDLLHFRAYIAETLILSHSRTPTRKRGRPTSRPLEEEPTPKTSKINRRDVRPVDNVRFDRMDHLPQFDDQEYGARCKYPNCKGKSRTMCSKCNVHLFLPKKITVS